jgi:hypothetical protein
VSVSVSIEVIAAKSSAAADVVLAMIADAAMAAILMRLRQELWVLQLDFLAVTYFPPPDCLSKKIRL